MKMPSGDNSTTRRYWSSLSITLALPKPWISVRQSTSFACTYPLKLVPNLVRSPFVLGRFFAVLTTGGYFLRTISKYRLFSLQMYSSSSVSA